MPYSASFKHYIKPFERAHRCNFRHTKAGTVVAKPYISIELRSDFIERLSHKPEIFLCCKRSAKSFGCSAVRHIIKETLSRAPNNGNYVRSLLCCRDRLCYIFIYIACCNYYIKIRAFLVAIEFKNCLISLLLFTLFILSTVSLCNDGSIIHG